MKLSIIIPVRNEEESIERTIVGIEQAFLKTSIHYEILVINDGSTDETESILKAISFASTSLRYLNNTGPKGFGYAVRLGLDEFEGDSVVIVMGDGSDDPEDILKYYNKLIEGYDCVFGSRFVPGGWVKDYPPFKLFLNRMANRFIQGLFGLKFNDTTNSFKAYRREVIESFRPFISTHFNLTVELPLKAFIRRWEIAVIPVSWTNRDKGVSKWRIKELGSRYLYVVFYLFIEKWLTRKDSFKNKKETFLSR